MKLFRDEAAARAATPRLDGEVLVATPLATRVLTVLAVSIILVGTGFAASATYVRRETASGWLVPDAGMTRIVASQGGIVSEVLAAEGDMLGKNAPIAELRSPDQTDRGSTLENLTTSLEARRRAAETESANAIESILRESANLAETKRSLDLELAQNRERERLQLERLELARGDLERAQGIAERGFLPTQQLELRRSAVLSIEQELASIRADGLALMRQQDEIEARQASIPGQLQAAEANYLDSIALLDAQATQTRSGAIWVATTPTEGSLSTVTVRPGQAVEAGQILAIVTPVSSRLVAEVFVPVRAAGFLRVGQRVKLRYAAYPYQKFGAGTGTIKQISSGVLAPDEVRVPGLTVSEPVLRVTVELGETTIAAYGEVRPLKAGGGLTADIELDRRTLLEWLFDPIYAVARR